MDKLTEHLRSVDETYRQHAWHALTFALKLFVAGFCCFIHALLPFLFEKTGSRIIQRLYGDMVLHRHELGKTGRVEVQGNTGEKGDGSPRDTVLNS